MKSAAANWILLLHKGGGQRESFTLSEGVTAIGRDPASQIVLNSSSISRHHAEIACGPAGVTIKDLKSRNGIHVNGVPRTQAELQFGDKIRICEFDFELTSTAPPDSDRAAPQVTLEAAVKLDQTIEQKLQLPELPHERQLATLYHVCFWVAEGVEEDEFVSRSLRLLLQALNAVEIQLYSQDRKLVQHVSESNGKPTIKLAAFLAKEFQAAGEAQVIHGRDIARHQRGVGECNYLVGPLGGSSMETDKRSFLVALRTEDQADFTPEDRVLLQAVCQLWVRGLNKTNQMTELRKENARLKKSDRGKFVGSSEVIESFREKALKAARTNATILMAGETGSGKEVVAQFIHDNSPRHSGPLAKVNCAAIPDTLIESELFGCKKGAFSGADRDRKGKFAQAHKGTLFLDEIGEMPLMVQAKVLRAIENREVQPLGSEETLKVDIRILAATNRDLQAMVRDGTFREDLYYRLDVQNLRIPPLRERLEDIDELVAHFLKLTCEENGLADLSFDASGLQALKEHDWPGNVRELWNVVQRCALNAEELTIDAAAVKEHGLKPSVARRA